MSDDELARDVLRDLGGLDRLARRGAARGGQFARSRASREFAELRLAALVLGDLMRLARMHVEHGRTVCWGPPQESEATLTLLLLGAINNVVALHRLLVDGLLLPARTVARAHVEGLVLLVALVADRATYDAYRAWNGSPEDGTHHWRRFLSPKRLREIVSAELASGLGADASEANEFRHTTYAWLSGGVHAHPTALVALVFEAPDGLDTGGPMFGGGATEGTVATLTTLNWLHFELISLFLATLAKKHGWSTPTNVEDGAWIRFRWRVLQSLHRHNSDVRERAERLACRAAYARAAT